MRIYDKLEKYKREHKKIAKQLGYKPEIVKLIANAASDIEIDRIMITARKDAYARR